MSVVERVARAMFDSLKGEVHNTEWEFGAGPTNLDEETKDMYRKMARAALEAVREPSREMVDKWQDHTGAGMAKVQDCAFAWRVGIDAALEQGT